ncbi:MAG: LLM class flavin-dependent oxidoreductase, partial [Acidimicrobiales bacterium]
MGDGVLWGVHVPTFDPFGSGIPPVVESARRAESCGFDAVWVGDHLVSPAPVLDSLCVLSAVASVTSRVEVGVSVLQLGLRHLVWTAKQLATIDAIAPGRLRLGVGVGGEFPDEFVAAGVARETRGRRLDEMLEVLPALLRGEAVDRRGEHVSVSLPGLKPAVSTMPPVSVGGRSDAALVRAARYGDQWVG